MKSLGGRNLVLPSLKDFEKMGMRRSPKYKFWKYDKVLKEYKIKSDPLVTATSDYAKKVYNYVGNETFIVALKKPIQDATPIKLENSKKRYIDVGKEGLLEKFAQMLYVTKWEIPENGNIRPYIEVLRGLGETPGAGFIEKILAWTNKYGLLFSEPIPQALIENNYELRFLPFSDAFYYAICAEKTNVPYFLSVMAFCELNRYALRLLFVSWLYSNDAEIREKINSLRVDDKEALAAKADALEAIIEGYDIIGPGKARGFEKFMEQKKQRKLTEEERQACHKRLAFLELGEQMAVWIRLETPARIELKALPKKEAEPIKNILAMKPRYQCASLFAAIMLEALSALNMNSRYRICPKCEKIFDIGKGRKDRKYCSKECKAESRYERERAKRRNNKGGIS